MPTVTTLGLAINAPTSTQGNTTSADACQPQIQQDVDLVPLWRLLATVVFTDLAASAIVVFINSGSEAG
ncbi:unnamed protein product [Phytophthora lilii]|uniref:Unnamed protein product n=1 Tax=Phytophthora lilii TaxID=2077276 RepID=A0A9W6WES8_9STRA|nr:unnamed protein product [Phytophthora lilii]